MAQKRLRCHCKVHIICRDKVHFTHKSFPNNRKPWLNHSIIYYRAPKPSSDIYLQWYVTSCRPNVDNTFWAFPVEAISDYTHNRQWFVNVIVWPITLCLLTEILSTRDRYIRSCIYAKPSALCLRILCYQSLLDKQPWVPSCTDAWKSPQTRVSSSCNQQGWSSSGERRIWRWGKRMGFAGWPVGWRGQDCRYDFHVLSALKVPGFALVSLITSQITTKLERYGP